MDGLTALSHQNELLNSESSRYSHESSKNSYDEIWNSIVKHKDEITFGAFALGAVGAAALAYNSIRRGNWSYFAGSTGNKIEGIAVGSTLKPGTSFGIEEQYALLKNNASVHDPIFQPLVKELKGSALPITPNSLQTALESMIANQGKLDKRYVGSVLWLQKGIIDRSQAPAILNNFARTEASMRGIDTTAMTSSQLFAALDAASAGNVTAFKLADRISNYAKIGFGFSDQQLNDPRLARMLLEKGYNTEMPLAINISTRIRGVEDTFNKQASLNNLVEYLGNGGRMQRVSKNDLNIMDLLASARSAGAQTSEAAAWKQVKITPTTVSIIRDYPGSLRHIGDYPIDLLYSASKL